MKVSVVIPNWNGAEKLKRNLPKVLEVHGVYEVIVSDDASTDDSIKLLREEFPKVKVIERKTNGGFSSNVNTGAKVASGDLIFLLNTDAVPEKDCLKFVLPHFENPRVFSVGLSSGGSWSWARFKDGYFWHYMSKDEPKDSHQTLWVSGGNGVFKRSVWDTLGGMDEMFNPFYEEDLDLGYRATKRGFINIFEPKAKVEHRSEKGVISENFSKQKISSIAQRNQLLFIWKNITSKKLIRDHKLALWKMVLFHPKYWKTFWSGFGKIDEIRKKRTIEEKEEVIPDEEILAKYN